MKSPTIRVLIFTATLPLLAVLQSLRTSGRAAVPLAQNPSSFEVAWYKIGGGGGTSSGGSFTLSGSPGQSAAARLSGGNYTLDGGFWSFAVGIQTVGAPLLKVSRSGPNVIISWPSSSTGFVLEVTESLATPNWQTVAESPVVSGDQNVLVILPASGARFYRLRHP